MQSLVTLENEVDSSARSAVFQTPLDKQPLCAVKCVWNIGSRHTDAALLYGNEEDVGWTILESGMPERKSSLPQRGMISLVVIKC